MKQLKKMMALALAIVMTITSMPLMQREVKAEDTKWYDGFGYRITNGTVEIVDCQKNDESIIIPEQIEGYPVTEIGRCAFIGYDELKSIVIPDSVVGIGEFAFSGCSDLDNVIIPNSVMSMGEGSFNKCINLKNIVLSVQIKCIDQGAFADCESLEEIIIPDSVVGIEKTAFINCTKLKYVSFPNKMDYINDAAFANCSSLINLTVPDCGHGLGEGIWQNCESLENVVFMKGTTRINSGDFFHCTSLAYIEIPTSVTSIGQGAFSVCDNLKKITIPKSVTTIEKAAIPTTTTIYGYINSAAETYAKENGNEFVSIGVDYTWEDPEEVQDDNILFTLFKKDAFSEWNTVSGGDKENIQIYSAIANYSNRQNDVINAKIDIDYSEINTELSFENNEYHNYVIPYDVIESWEKNAKTSDDIYMEKDAKDEKPYISTVFARVNMSDDSQAYEEIRTNKIKILEDNRYDVIISAVGAKEGATYYISQDNVHKISSSTGRFYGQDLYNVFRKNYKTYVYVKNPDGTASTPVEIKMEKTELSPVVQDFLQQSTFNLLGKDKTIMNVSDSIPLIGGAKLKMDWVDFPFGAQVESDRIKISLGVNLFNQEITDVGKAKIRWKSFKEQVNLIDQKVNKDNNIENSLFWAKSANGFLDGWNTGISKNNLKFFLLGYLEVQITENGLVVTDAGGYAEADLYFRYTQQGTMLFVPSYCYVMAYAKANLSINMIRLLADSEVPFDIGVDLKIDPALQIGGGAGVKDAVSAGVYGRGSLPFENNFATQYRKWQLKGELGVEGELFYLQGSKKILDGTVTVIDEYYGNPQQLRAYTNIIKNTSPIFNLNKSNKTEITLASRDYLNATSKWMGDGNTSKTGTARKAVQFRKVGSVSNGGMTVSNLQTSVYKNSQCQLVTLGDKMIMAWIEDDADRDTYNRMRLVYSVYDSVSQTWSEPRAVYDNGHLDASPSLASDGTNVYIAWQKIDATMDCADESAVDKILESAEIFCAKYDVENNAFKQVSKLTDNNTYDYAPSVSIKDGQAVVYWAESIPDDLSSNNSKMLKYTWGGDNQTLYTGLNYILGIDSTDDAVTYIMNGGGDTEASQNVEIFTNGKKIIPEKEEDVSVLNFTYGLFGGKETLFYADETNLHYVSDGEVKDVFREGRSIDGNLQVAGNGDSTVVIWSELTEEGSEFYTCRYENGTWSQAVLLSDMDSVVSNLSAVYFNNQVRGVFNRTERTETSDDEGESYYESGRTDLCQFVTEEITDLEISSVYVDESELTRGEKSEISVIIKNDGIKTIHSISFDISDTLGNQQTVIKDVNLVSGAEECLELDYIVPENLAETVVTVAGTVTDAVDVDESNNSADLEIGYCDISIDDLSVEEVGNVYRIAGIVSNRSGVNAEGVSVTACFGVEESEDYTTIDLGTMKPKQKYRVELLLNKSDVVFEDGAYMVYFKAETSGSEFNDMNNEGVATITEYHFHEFEEKVTPATVQSDGKVVEICSVCGEEGETGVIPAIGKAELSISDYVYTGDWITPPGVTVKDTTKKEISEEYYSVVYRNEEGENALQIKDAGIYTAVIMFQGRYSGTEELEFKVSENTTSVEINGFQISTTVGGMRTVYSVEPEINGMEVVERGLVYGLGGYASEEDMYVGADSYYVMHSAATSNGLFGSKCGTSPTADSYGMTMMQNIGTASAAALSATYYVRAYAKLSDGSYVYSRISSYSAYNVAKILYDNQMMNTLSGHEYLYDNILSIVDSEYPKVEYPVSGTLVKP